MFSSLITSFRAFNRSIRYYLLASMLLGLGVDGVYSVLFNLFLVRLNFDAEFIGIINSAGLFAFALTSMPAGMAGGRWGSRKIILVGLLVVLSGAMLLPLGQYVPPRWQTVWLMTSYALLMGGWSAVFVNGSSFMMSAVSAEKRNSLFSIQTAMGATAAFIGSFVGGILPETIGRLIDRPLTDPTPYGIPMQIMAVMMIPAFLLLLQTEEPDQSVQADNAAGKGRSLNLWALPLGLLGLIAFIRMLQVTGLATTATFINVYLDTELQVPTSRIGILTSFSRLAAVGGALLIPYLAKRMSNIWIALIGSFGSALFIIPIALIPHWTVAGGGFIGARFLTGMRYPAFQVYILEMFDTKRHAFISGLMAFSAGLSFAIMALSGGYIITLFSFQNLFLTGAGLTIIGSAILLSFHLFRHRLPVPVAAD